METISYIQRAIDFCEDNILSDIPADVIASQAYMSSFQFQKVFSIICDVSLGEYIRNRRLELAGLEIVSSKTKIIDIAYKYGYESPESFSRAFTRFHGVSPLATRGHAELLNHFPKISVKSIIGGQQNMNKLKQRGYTVKENGPIYYTEDMDKTAEWFEKTLGWYATIDSRREDGKGNYGCVLPIPDELVTMKIAVFTGMHLSYGEPVKNVIAFMCVEGLDELHAFVKKSGWKQITDIIEEPWGARECQVTTIDGSILKFFELDE